MTNIAHDLQLTCSVESNMDGTPRYNHNRITNVIISKVGAMIVNHMRAKPVGNFGSRVPH